MAQVNLLSATWIDVNTNVTRNRLPDRLPDEQAIILSSLYNLLGCGIGERSRTFQPTYGTVLYRMIHEPIDQQSADALRVGLIQAINKWEPRIALDYSQTGVTPDFDLPGFRIRLTFSLILTGNVYSQEFTIRK